MCLKKRRPGQDLGHDHKSTPEIEGIGLPLRGVAMGGTGKIAREEDLNLPDTEIDATKGNTADLGPTPPSLRHRQEATHPTAHQAPPGEKALATAVVAVPLEAQAPRLCPPRAQMIPRDDDSPSLNHN